jgi:hypothetical protein
MMDIRRRGFIFGAAASALIIPNKTFFILPRSEGVWVPLQDGPLFLSPGQTLNLELRAQIGAIYWKQHWSRDADRFQTASQMRVRLFPEQRTAVLEEVA